MNKADLVLNNLQWNQTEPFNSVYPTACWTLRELSFNWKKICMPKLLLEFVWESKSSHISFSTLSYSIFSSTLEKYIINFINLI